MHLLLSLHVLLAVVLHLLIGFGHLVLERAHRLLVLQHGVVETQLRLVFRDAAAQTREDRYRHRHTDIRTAIVVQLTEEMVISRTVSQIGVVVGAVTARQAY